jgi:hypothetical protein
MALITLASLLDLWQALFGFRLTRKVSRYCYIALEMDHRPALGASQALKMLWSAWPRGAGMGPPALLATVGELLNQIGCSLFCLQAKELA